MKLWNRLQRLTHPIPLGATITTFTSSGNLELILSKCPRRKPCERPRVAPGCSACESHMCICVCVVEGKEKEYKVKKVKGKESRQELRLIEIVANMFTSTYREEIFVEISLCSVGRQQQNHFGSSDSLSYFAVVAEMISVSRRTDTCMHLPKCALVFSESACASFVSRGRASPQANLTRQTHP